MSYQKWRAAPAGLAVMVLCVLSLGAGLREDEVQCEHAAVQLDECCPDLDATELRCFYSTGCSGSATLLRYRFARAKRPTQMSEARR